MSDRDRDWEVSVSMALRIKEAVDHEVTNTVVPAVLAAVQGQVREAQLWALCKAIAILSPQDHTGGVAMLLVDDLVQGEKARELTELERRLLAEVEPHWKADHERRRDV